MDKMVSMVLDLYRKSVDQVGVSDRVSQLLELKKHVDHLKYHVYG